MRLFLLDTDMKYNKDKASLELKCRLDEAGRKTGKCIDLYRFGQILGQWMLDVRKGVFDDNN